MNKRKWQDCSKLLGRDLEKNQRDLGAVPDNVLEDQAPLIGLGPVALLLLLVQDSPFVRELRGLFGEGFDVLILDLGWCRG